MSEITIIEAHQTASEAVARQQQLAALDKPAYPLEDEPAPLTLFQLIFGWPGRYAERCAQEGRANHIKRLRVVIEQKREMLSQLPDLALARKHAAQLAYSVTLQEIDCWRDVEAAKAKSDIKRLSAELELLEAEQCA